MNGSLDVTDNTERCQTRVEHLADWTWEVDERGVYTYASPQVEAILGYRPDEIIGRTPFDLMPPEEAQRVRAVFEQHAREGKPLVLLENVNRHKDGRRVILETIGVPLGHFGGRARGYRGVDRDVTARKEVEAELRRLEREKSLILDSTDEIIAYHDTEHRLVWANKAYLDAIGSTLAEVRGRECFEIWGLGRLCEGCPCVEAIRTGQPCKAELSPENQPHWPPTQGEWLVRSAPVRGDNGAVIGAIEVARNVTAQRQQERKQRDTEARLEQTQRLESLGVMAGGIAHDFNNILMGIMGYADLSLDEMAPLSPGREMIGEIKRAAVRAAELCGQMLAYAGKGRLEKRDISMSDLVDETLHMIRTCISRNCELNLSMGKHLPGMHGDPSQIRQVLMNVALNASEAIGDRSGVVTISTGAMDCSGDGPAEGYVVAPPSPGVYVYVEVSDTGCGMDQSTRKRMFDPFFTTKFTGRGLGLSAVLGIVRAHAGALRVHTEVGKGTTIRLLFPASAGAASDAGAGGDTTGWRGRGTVLLVDDEETVRTVIGMLLRRLGLDVLTAEDGRAAVELYRERQADIRVVLLDLTMPRMNGEDAFRELRSINPHVRVILASGYSVNDMTARFAGKGLAACVHKPYTIERLREVLSALLPAADSAPAVEQNPSPNPAAVCKAADPLC